MTLPQHPKASSNHHYTHPRRRNVVVWFGAVILVAGLLSLVWDVSLFSNSYNSVVDKSSSKRFKYLMIVAHPDDEALWAGDFLAAKGNETYVVVTSGKSKLTEIRQEEFEAVRKEFGYTGEFLPGKDKFAYKKQLERSIRKRIRQLICNSPWSKIISHGPEGEYGHPLHHAVYDAVSDAVQYCCQSADLLHVFQASEPPTKIKKLKDADWSSKKVKALQLYESQTNVIFHTFLGWKELIVPISAYNLTKANQTCLDKDVRAHSTNFCRLHKYLEVPHGNQKRRRQLANEFRLMFDERNKPIDRIHFRNQGIGC